MTGTHASSYRAFEGVDRAACRGKDPEIFFPSQGESAEEAKTICGGCPVTEPCLRYALSIREPLGIWGGLNESERRALQH